MFKKFLLKLALKGFIKASNKLIAKGKSIDLNKNDVNDLVEGVKGCEKALEYQNKKEELNKEEK